MQSALSDTSPEAEQVQMALLRQASIARRLSLVSDLSQMVLQLSWQGLRRAHPGASEREIRLRSVALNYGQAVADSLAAALEERQIMSIPPTILAAMIPVIDAFEQLGVAYYIGGSVASSLHGLPRSTLNVDLIADLRLEHVQPLVTRLQDAYCLDEAAIRTAIQRRASCNLIHLETMLKVDIFVLKTRPFDQGAFQRIQQHHASQTEPARMLVLSSAEDAVLAKLGWYRMGGEVSERQWNDLLGILTVQGTALDLPYLRHWAADLQVTDLLERALAEAHLGE
jgi:hypothetical protein